ncbi:MAG: hypothetical protein CFE46_17360 [Burkholderiales bacterium PBB6]|nr:MAG: hypothetical protein CFE46_17360 [Burkholderiales bacterium PBB6]
MSNEPHSAAMRPALQALMGDWPVALACLNASHRVEWVNRAFEALTGLTQAALQGRPIEDVLPPALPEQSWRSGHRPDGHAWHAREHWLERPDGGRWLTLLDMAALVPPGADAALHQMQLAVDLADVIIWRHDLRTGYINCSERGWKTMGRPPGPQGWTGQELLALVHPDDRIPLETAYRQALAGQGPVDVMTRYITQNNSWRHAMTRRVLQLDADGQPEALVGVAIDISERERVLAELHSAHQRFTLMADGVGIGTWWHDVATGENHWDERMWALRGLHPQPQAPSIEDMLNLVHPSDRAAVRQQISRPAEASRAPHYEFRVVLPDGRERWLASRSVQVLDAQGNTLQRLGANWDVTDARQAAAARHDQALAQRESQAKSELLARLSHELRTPLNAILGFTRLLITGQEHDTPASRQDKLGHLLSAGNHLLSLVNDVLQLARPEEDPNGPITLIDLALDELVAQSLPMLHWHASERQVQLTAAVPPLLTVRADALRLRQVVLNLLSNAVKYNRLGGSVHVTARGDGDLVHLDVVDTGIGMAPEQVDLAFQPFQRLSQPGAGVEGVGIGLAIVKSLVLRMGGSIEVSSQPGQGSRFSLTLPRGVQALRPSDAIANAPAMPLPSTPTVASAPTPLPFGASVPSGGLLYIEDNPVNVMIVAELAARRGQPAFFHAGTGAEGMALARAQRPRLILLDMHLPDCHGQQVLAWLKADPVTRHIPCIALSANALQDDIDHALAMGFAGYWTKPLDFAVFERTMNTVFGPPTQANAGSSIGQTGI